MTLWINFSGTVAFLGNLSLYGEDRLENDVLRPSYHWHVLRNTEPKIKGDHMKNLISNQKGRVLPPLVLYAIGVPGFVCILLWAFFFRG
jgi:hypothetical protein